MLRPSSVHTGDWLFICVSCLNCNATLFLLKWADLIGLEGSIVIKLMFRIWIFKTSSPKKQLKCLPLWWAWISSKATAGLRHNQHKQTTTQSTRAALQKKRGACFDLPWPASGGSSLQTCPGGRCCPLGGWHGAAAGRAAPPAARTDLEKGERGSRGSA